MTNYSLGKLATYTHTIYVNQVSFVRAEIVFAPAAKWAERLKYHLN
jgi:hypothetical protein